MHKYILSLMLICLSAMGIAAQGVTVVHMAVAWSPDSRYLSFARMEVTNTTPRTTKSDIYIARADGTELRRVTGENGNENFPSWSRDGRTIYFGGGSPGSREAEIFAIGTDGERLRIIARVPGYDGAPVVSPDGKRIAFHTERDVGKPQIYVMNINGTDAKRLTDDAKVAYYNPIWSPDGNKIVYYREIGDNKDQIWSMNADGTGQTLLTNNIGHNFYPSWSADGTRIIFCSNRDGDELGIWTMNADGSDVKKLEAVKSFFARYSPDGKKIAYISGRFPESSITVANADGSDPHELKFEK